MNITLRLAWRNLWRQPRRTWLTAGAMIFSNVLLVFMMSLQFGMYGLMIDNTLRSLTGHMQVQAPGYKDDAKIHQSIPNILPLARSLREQLGVSTVAARATTFALASSEDRSYGIQIAGVEPEFEPQVSSLPGLLTSGRMPRAGGAEIVIGQVLARNLKVDIGAELTLLGSGRDGSFAAAVAEVVGVFDSGVADLDRNLAQVPLSFFQDTFFMQGGGHQIVINAPGVDQAPALQSRVETLLPADDELVVHDWDTLLPGLKQAIRADISSAFFTYGVLVILVAFSVLNTQLMSVLERTREFGIVMSLGLTPGRLSRLVMLETAIMGLIGLALGALLGAAITAWFGLRGVAFPGMEELAGSFNLPARFYPRITPLSLLAGPAVVFLFTLIAALYPALRLHWLHPVAAMRAA